MEMACTSGKHFPNAFKFLHCFLEKSQEIKLTMVCSPFEKIIRFLFRDVLGAVHIREKVFNFTSALFFTCFYLRGRGGVVVSALDFRPQVRWFDAQSLP